MPKQEVEKIYKEIQVALFRLIPEKWEKLYLYASVLGGRGEMFFYYFPKKTILKPKPINCYEVAQKFGINEEQYSIELSKLYEKIRRLNELAINKWTNITISIENCLFSIEYNFEDILHSVYTDEQRHVYWEYKYLKTPIESLSKSNQNFIRYYSKEPMPKTYLYTEGIYINNKLDVKKENKLVQAELQEEQIMASKEKPKIRNQILNF